MNILVGILYFIIAALFSYNFSVLIKKIKGGSQKVNKYSLFATSSLVFIFLSECIASFGFSLYIVLVAQIYLLGTMIYIVYNKRNNGER